MRLLSYNILDGGEGRADPLGEVIEAQRADGVALVEADDPAVVGRIASRLKMDFVTGQSAHHSAVLMVRGKILESVNHAVLHDGFDGSFIEATVQPAGGSVLTIGVVHLHAHATEADETIRQRQLQTILKVFQGRRAAGVPHILCGDFNANSPTQRIDFSKAKPATIKEAAANGGDVPRRVVRELLDAGYVDTLAHVRGPAADTMGSFSTQHPQQRVDYVFTCGFPPAAIADAWIEHDRLAKYASDHFPAGVELR
jgi:endonuclease/exonuclease/phosphatase family metal-dependent hydrolase